MCLLMLFVFEDVVVHWRICVSSFVWIFVKEVYFRRFDIRVNQTQCSDFTQLDEHIQQTSVWPRIDCKSTNIFKLFPNSHFRFLLWCFSGSCACEFEDCFQFHACFWNWRVRSFLSPHPFVVYGCKRRYFCSVLSIRGSWVCETDNFRTVDEGHFVALSSHEGLICTMFVDFVVISTVHDWGDVVLCFRSDCSKPNNLSSFWT